MKNLIVLLLICNVCSCTTSTTENIDKEPTKIQNKLLVKLNKDDLANIIPEEILGYTPQQEPKGLDMQLQNASFSFTTQYYYKENDSINIELFDYLDCPMEYERYDALWWNSGNEVDNDELSAKYVLIDTGIDSWEVFDKVNKRTTVYVGVDRRFYLIFECFGKENTDFISGISKDFDYGKLQMK